jgi:hypothetical protein
MTVELGAVTEPGSMSAVLAESLGDPTARVLYPSAAGWVDDTGTLVAGPGGDRRLTVVERSDVEVAAIEHDVMARPAALESAVSTLGLLAEHQALDARTQARLQPRRSLERPRGRRRDLTASGARSPRRGQQQILTLALQARLAVRRTDTSWQPRSDARDDLLGLAEGVTEQVIAERGLGSFLEALAVMSPSSRSGRESCVRRWSASWTACEQAT